MQHLPNASTDDLRHIPGTHTHNILYIKHTNTYSPATCHLHLATSNAVTCEISSYAIDIQLCSQLLVYRPARKSGDMKASMNM